MLRMNTALFKLYLGSMELDCVISESCYKVTILQIKLSKMTIDSHFLIIIL